MPLDRRRFLTLCAACSSATIAGCWTLPDWGSGKIDDWQYDPNDSNAEDGQGAANGDAGGAGNGESIGLAAGGAADVGTFRRNVDEGYLPLPESMSYEGLFHEYYFDTGGDGSCERLFCPTYTPAVTPDPLSDDLERYLSVGLESGLSQSEFERPALNLAVVLDISGSMGASFDDYYYDAYGNRQKAEGETSRPKIDVAKDALIAMTHHLQPEDRFGVVLFNHDAYLAKPLREVGNTDMDAIRGHIRDDIEPDGGTNLSAGIDRSDGEMTAYDGANSDEYENRSIVLTDAQINQAERSAGELRRGLEASADRGHHTTVVGVGVDFNADLIDQLTAIRGANYYSVHSEDEFERRMDEEFEYIVTPLVYDLSLELESEGYEIAQVYGSTAGQESAGELMRVNTLFPSQRTDGEAKGGVVLVQVEQTDGAQASGDASLSLEANWETRSGQRESATETVSFPAGDGERYGSDAVRKAILLARHANLLKNWTVHQREAALVDADGGIDQPPADDRLGEWELQSETLAVSAPYDDRLAEFRDHFEAEAAAVGDDALEQELELLDAILEAA